MQWTFACILLASIAIISASDHGIRSKRDLSFVKSYILSKIFGSYKNDTTPLPPKPANYRLFRVPGFDNILLKAVPKVPVVLETDAPPPSILEVTESAHAPVHPSIAIVSKYLGTNQLNDTLFALRGVKDLLQSGVLTAKREGIDLTAAHKDSLPSVLVGSSQIVVDEARRPIIVYPTPEQVPRYPNLPIPSKYSYKQVNNGGVMSYTAHDNQNVMVTESKRPVPLPSTISYRIQDILSLGIHRLPTSPVMRVKSPSPISVFEVPKFQVPHQMVKVMPSFIPSGYSYNQVHSDGSVTTYSGSGNVEEHEGGTPVVITEAKPTMSVVVAEMEGYPASIPVINVPKVQMPFQPVKVPIPSSGYSYNHVHNDGSVTTYSGSGHVVEHEGEKSAVVITEAGRPTVVVSDVEGPPAPFPVLNHRFNVPKVQMPTNSGYSYNHVHNDGSVTTFSGSGHVVEHDRRKSAVVITEPGRPTVVVSNEEGRPEPFPVFKVPKVKVPYGSGYSYNHVHNDGTVTNYSGSGHVVENEGEKSAVVITEPGRPTVVVSDVEGPPAPIPVFNSPKIKVPSGSRYSYNQVHNDGSVSTYSGSGYQESEKPAVVITEPGRPTVVVADVERSPVPFPVFNAPSVKFPSNSGYSYNHAHNDGSVSTYSGPSHKEGKPSAVITEPGRPTVVIAGAEGPPAPFPIFNVPNVKQHFGSGYSYNHVRNDGSVTTYSGSGHVLEHEDIHPSVVITEPGRPTVVVSNVEGPPAPFPVYNVPRIKAPSGSEYFYNHVHNDGSVTTYSRPRHEGGKPAVVIDEPGRPTVVVADTEIPPGPFPVFNAHPSDSGFSYNHVHNDGSITSYSGSGHVVVHEGKKAPVVITEHGRPTVVVSDVGGPPAPFPVFNVPRVKPPSGSDLVHDDGSMTMYSGQLKDHRGDTSAVVITENKQPFPLPTFVTNRIENVAVSAMAGRPPTSFYRRPTSAYQEQSVLVEAGPDYVDHVRYNPYEKPHHPNVGEHVKVYAGNHHDEQSQPTNVPSGFSYKTVHEDGSVTSYTDAGVVEGAHAVPDRPFLYPTGPAAPLVNDISGKESLAKTVICKDPAHSHVSKKQHSHIVAANSNSSKFSYTTISEGGSSTTYSGSGHVEHNHVNNAAYVDANPIEANPTFLVTQTNDDNPEKVSLTPVLSQYMYKQVNHHKPDELTVVNVGDVPVVDGHSIIKASSAGSGKSKLHSVEVSKVPKEYVFIPPSSTKEPVPTKKPVGRVPSSTKAATETVPSTSKAPLTAVATSTKISHSSKPKRVFRHRVKTSTSTSTSKILKTSAPLTTTPKVSSTTVVTSSEGSFSANPIVVLPEEKVFSFKQERTDGSSITVVGNKENNVSVVEEPKISPNRGDIPDSTY